MMRCIWLYMMSICGWVYTYACIGVCLCNILLPTNTNLRVLTTETFPHHAFSQDTNYSFFPFLMFSLLHFSTHFRFPFQIFSYFSSSTFSHISSFFLFCKCFFNYFAKWFFILYILKGFVLIWNNICFNLKYYNNILIYSIFLFLVFFSVFLNLFPLFFPFTFLLSSLPSFFFSFSFLFLFYFLFVCFYLSFLHVLQHFRFAYFSFNFSLFLFLSFLCVFSHLY